MYAIRSYYAQRRAALAGDDVRESAPHVDVDRRRPVEGQHAGQQRVRRGFLAAFAQEACDGGEYAVHVAHPGQMVLAGKLDIARAGNVV